jgi:glyoxylase-like metal-dependent hydrolase (beta-lactamase superfamily II)
MRSKIRSERGPRFLGVFVSDGCADIYAGFTGLSSTGNVKKLPRSASTHGQSFRQPKRGLRSQFTGVGRRVYKDGNRGSGAMRILRNRKAASGEILILAAVCLFAAGRARAQTPQALPAQPLVDEKTMARVSDHVYALVGWPNIGIVLGNRGTLVIDTGLGERNGATIMRAVQKLEKGPVLYLTTTHYHSEHVTGEQAFPANTVLIRPLAQQEELNRLLPGHMARFREMSQQNKELLANVKMRTPDILFNGEMKLDLGGVTARLFRLGRAHTEGDMLIFVEEDSVLIPGDIVESKLFPIMPEESSMKGWIGVLDKLEPLKPRLIVPDHGELGDGSLIGKEKSMLQELQGRALDLKHQGKSAEEAGKLLTNELHAKHPDYGQAERIAADVKLVYAEAQ